MRAIIRQPRWLLGLAVAGMLLTALELRADARTDYMVRLMRTSDQFRVRAQAALSLGSAVGDPAVVRALSDAMRDEHPAVRAAVAASLERLGDPTALDALRGANSDPEPAVRTAVQRAVRSLERIARTRPPTTPTTPTIAAATASATGAREGSRYYIGIGVPGTKAPQVDRATLMRARQFIAQQASGIDGVVLAPDDESPPAALRAIRTNRLTGFYLDSSILRVEERPGGALRAEVSVVVQTYPERDVRAMLSGAATVTGGGVGPAQQQQAIEGAFNGALRRLGQSLEASAMR